MVVLGTWGLLEGAWNRKYSEVSLELGGSWSLKNAEGVQDQSWKNSEMLLEQKRGHPLTPLPSCVKPKLAARITSPKASTSAPSDLPEYDGRINPDCLIWDDWDPNYLECVSNRKCKRGMPEPTLYNPLGDELNHVTAKYLTESVDHTVNNPELARVLTEAKVAFATKQERKHR